MIKNYLPYLENLNSKLSKFFLSQEPYIFCHKGCSKCCKNGEYPFSEIEFAFIKIGLNKLPAKTKEQIFNKAAQIKVLKSKSKPPFYYECPFLINNECSVYDFRGIICRTFGLMTMKNNENSKIPFCAYEGLNYSNVLDKTRNVY